MDTSAVAVSDAIDRVVSHEALRPLGLTGYSAYSASKFAVYGLSQVLRAELKPQEILVSVVLPPNTDTPMLKAEQAQMPPEMRPIWESSRVVSATRVAEDLLRGVARGRFEIIPGLDNRLIVRLHRLSQTPLRAYFDWRVRQELQAQDPRQGGT